MSRAAILGAGDLGGAIAHALARAGRVSAITIVDARVEIAAGKALDLQQAAALDRSTVRIEAAGDALAAAGAAAIVIADEAGGTEWRGARGLALIDQLARAGGTAPLVFAGPGQADLMIAAAKDLGLRANQLVGSAGAAAVSAARALVGLELDQSGVDVQLSVAGRPPGLVVAWSSATVGGTLVTDRIPAHRLAAISRTLRALWPPGPQAIAAATAEIVQGLIDGSRRPLQALTMLDGEFGARGVAAMLPLTLGGGRILARHLPSLTPQERTEAGF